MTKIPVTILGAEAPSLRSRNARAQEQGPVGPAIDGGRSRWRMKLDPSQAMNMEIHL